MYSILIDPGADSSALRAASTAALLQNHLGLPRSCAFRDSELVDANPPLNNTSGPHPQDTKIVLGVGEGCGAEQKQDDGVSAGPFR